MKSPCKKDCPERAEECHGKCARYAAFWAWSEQQRKIRARKASEKAMSEGLRKAMVKKAARQRQWREK